MLQVHSAPQTQVTAIKPTGQHSKAFKFTTGLLVLLAVAALTKLLSVWGHDYIVKAQDNLYDSLWLNEDRITI